MPIDLNGTSYRTCLFDTNIVSESTKNPKRLFGKFIELITRENLIPCLSVFSILELRRKPELFQQFLDLFAPIPIMFLKNHSQLFSEEIAEYPYFRNVRPDLATLPGLLAKPGQSLREIMDKLFGTAETADLEQQWNDGQDEIVSGILSLKQNFPPTGTSYTAKQIREFAMLVTVQQVATQYPDFAKRFASSKTIFDTDCFPSIKFIAYTVMYKFYVDQRKPSRSDAFDLIIFSPTPYLDAIMTERHQAEVLRKIQKVDPFIHQLDIKTIRDLY